MTQYRSKDDRENFSQLSQSYAKFVLTASGKPMKDQHTELVNFDSQLQSILDEIVNIKSQENNTLQRKIADLHNKFTQRIAKLERNILTTIIKQKEQMNDQFQQIHEEASMNIEARSQQLLDKVAPKSTRQLRESSTPNVSVYNTCESPTSPYRKSHVQSPTTRLANHFNKSKLDQSRERILELRGRPQVSKPIMSSRDLIAYKKYILGSARSTSNNQTARSSASPNKPFRIILQSQAILIQQMALSAAQPELLEQALAENNFLAGDEPTQLDFRVSRELEANPPTADLPYLLAWFNFVSQFTTEAKANWPDPPKAAAGDDEFDLFAEDPEAEEAAKKDNEERKAKEGPPVGKSQIVFEVKPASSSVDLDELANRIMTEINYGEDLKWMEQYKKEPVAFGIYKLLIGCTMKDSISTDDLTEKMSSFTGMIEVSDEEDSDEEGEETKASGEKRMVEGELVQSIDIKSFNKV